ncbi:hypothetical protein DLM78_00280 [Leptospira stimsonii]|uniref:DUF1640 domain-containing protein n=2 Tax=Leptospira stimsonii TaxID=2202203 RepID=A0A8B3CT89_9LEPT|nr:hypothetical protein DLM78_00280 [Leptospira stimsonii]
MVMDFIQKLPRKLEDVLGTEGLDQFVDFLNSAFVASRAQILETSADRFELRVSTDISKIKIDLTAFKADMKNDFLEFKILIQSENAKFRSEIRMDIADFNSEIRKEIKELREETNQSRLEIVKSIVEIHKAIAVQTRWMFGAILGSAGLALAIEKILHSFPL